MKSSTTTTAPTRDMQSKPRLYTIYSELSKLKLSLLVVMSTATSFIMASPHGVDWLTLLWTVLGTTACASSAAALNQLAERARDQQMSRTAARPMPAKHVSRAHAFIFGIVLAYFGVATLAFGANILSAAIALCTILIYMLLYTPLKPLTSFNTIVGAIVGALPPLIGWVAAGDSMSMGGWIIAGILFVWQIPHFLALAWIYKDDYVKGGFKMLPSTDPTGELTARVCVISSLCLIPLCLFMTVASITGTFFAIIGCLLGIFMTIRSIAFWKQRTQKRALHLFFASIIYLPLALACMLIDRQTIQWIEIGI